MRHRSAIIAPCAAILAFATIAHAQSTRSGDAAGGSSAVGKGNSMSSKDSGSAQTSGSGGSATGGVGTTQSATEKAGSMPAPDSRGTGVKGRANQPAGTGR
jgi:hypothetical protein